MDCMLFIDTRNLKTKQRCQDLSIAPNIFIFYITKYTVIQTDCDRLSSNTVYCS